MTVVKLNWSEVILAGNVGLMRRISALKKTRDEPYGKPDLEPWGLDVDGAAAEMAVAKFADVFWSGSIGRLDIDAGPYQVRQTTLDYGCLILHDKDADSKPFVLVTGAAPVMNLRGWIWARDGKNSLYWEPEKGRTPCYFVPQHALRPMDTLPRADAAAIVARRYEMESNHEAP